MTINMFLAQRQENIYYFIALIKKNITWSLKIKRILRITLKKNNYLFPFNRTSLCKVHIYKLQLIWPKQFLFFFGLAPRIQTKA
jgi:hypothetical protein